MKTLWIVHRREEEQAWLAELSPLSVNVVIGHPESRDFQGSPKPDGVLLGLDEDWERELAFAQNEAPKHPAARWWLAGEPHQRETATRLFDSLPHSFLDLSEPSTALQTALNPGLEEETAVPLSKRRDRALLAARFRERFHDLDPESFLALLDPSPGDRPLLIVGEAGTGKRLLARYLHAHTDPVPGPFFEIDGREISETEGFWRALSSAPRGPGLCVSVIAVDALPPSTQRSLASSLELGVFPGAVGDLRWILLADPERRLEEDLARVVRLRFAIPALRERPAALAAFAHERVGGQLGEEPGAFLEALARRRLRGNFRELDALLAAAVERAGGEPLGQVHLHARPLRPEEAAPGGAAGEPSPRVDDTSAASDTSQVSDTSSETPSTILGAGRHLGGLEETVSRVLGEVVDRPSQRAPIETPPADPSPVVSVAAQEASPTPSEEARPPGVALGSTSLRSLSHALAHELRNPLSTVRTFATLLPEQHHDEAFRSQFSELVNADIGRIERTLAQLQRFTDLPRQSPSPIAFNHLVREILVGLRPRINERRLVVLEELDRDVQAIGADPKRLRFALGSVFERALEWTQEGGDLYVTVRAKEGPRGGVHFSLRFQGGTEQMGADDLAPARASLSFTLAEEIFGELGGVLRIEADGRDGVVVGSLPR